MGTTYTVILLDEFDWEYQDFSKEQAKKKFEEKYPVAELLGEWYGALVYDINKVYPLLEDNKKFLTSFCDLVYYQPDYSLGLQRLDET